MSAFFEVSVLGKEVTENTLCVRPASVFESSANCLSVGREFDMAWLTVIKLVSQLRRSE